MDLLNLLSTPTTDEHWMDRAACLQVDPNVMQPERATEAEVADARRFCHTAGPGGGKCPVFYDCLAHAKAQEPAYGVHAGQWFGEPPVWESVLVCEYAECGAVFRAERHRGVFPRFCSKACRVAAHTASKVLA